MTDLRTLLEQRGITQAVVIDDVFDEVPRPDELAAESWSTFFDDLGENGHAQLGQLYPAYETTEREDLLASQAFIDALWENRAALPVPARDTLFREYENTNAIERAGLEALITALTALGLTCTRMGRDERDEARTAELIFVDLFLGYQQLVDDIKRAIERVKALVANRIQTPPLVVLMSRSPRLQEKRDEFRDTAGLLGTIFRVVSKTDLAKEGTLENILFRLATHLPDAQRVARFVHAWDNGLNQARGRFIQLLRRLDLPDLAQIHALLLEFEGEKLGDYLLDVADRVLQHEIERDGDTIAASLELNAIDVTKYPAPHLRGSPDLQELVHRMIFLNPRRLSLTETNGVPDIRFGDVLRWAGADGVLTVRVSLVITPACDLVRRGAQRVMLLSGKLEPLVPGSWTYAGQSMRTPITILPDGSRMWVSWDLKDVQTLSWTDLDAQLANNGLLRRIGRLRELYALELQQKLLADFGRVGQLAPMPAYFPVLASVFYVGTDGKAKQLILDELESAVYVGRATKPQPVHRLVLSEQACDRMRDAVQALDSNLVHTAARTSVNDIKADRIFFAKFERGEIELSTEHGKSKTLKSADDSKVYATIIRGGDLAAGAETANDMRRSALLLKVADVGTASAEEAG
ncbi:MAG: hypothetical protein EPO27_13375 [Betaproteobacteria bacterium]|nr:MAG: hypothetical protein EPO27_13375 [Betaproteobacteria bacterium]